jgi:hypothetical protein
MSDAALPVSPVGVWVQLLVGEEKQGESFKIEQTPRNVNALKMAVFPELTPREVAKCLVFAPGADPKTEDPLGPGGPMPGDTSSKNPLIVVSPKHQQQPPQDGELRCCSRILGLNVLLQIRKSCLTLLLHHTIESLPELGQQVKLLEAQHDAERAKRQKLERDVIIFQMVALQARTTTEKVLATADDTLAGAFERAQIVPIWLPPLSTQNQNIWAGPWEAYEITDEANREGSAIQPAIHQSFAPNFPASSAFEFKDTHSGWNHLTQDATLFLRDRPNVELSIGALFEWVGQDESGFPSKKHQAKFLRDCMRLYLRCGRDREVHGVISDLSRIVAVKLIRIEAGVPVVEKTSVLSGTQVRDVLTRFALATPEQLSVQCLAWTFPAGGTSSRTVYGGKALGAGLHGKIFSSSDGSVFIKSFRTEAECTQETTNLKILMAYKVPFTVRLEAVSVDGKAFMGTPIGLPFKKFQGQTVVWTMGVKLLQCLRRVHEAGLCHRDVRPENMIVAGGDVCLIDWASASPSNAECEYIGTLCYTPQSILESLEMAEEIVKPTPVHDLESLVYSIFDVSRPPESRPRALTVSNTVFFYARFTAIKEAWEQESKDSPHLAELLGIARSGNYSALEEAFRKH